MLRGWYLTIFAARIALISIYIKKISPQMIQTYDKYLIHNILEQMMDEDITEKTITFEDDFIIRKITIKYEIDDRPKYKD